MKWMDAEEYLRLQLKQQESKWDFVNSWPLAQVLAMCRFAEEYHIAMLPNPVNYDASHEQTESR